jgi:hypothetical protein
MFKEWSDKRVKRISLRQKRLSLSPPKLSNRAEVEWTKKHSAGRGAMQTVEEDIVQSLKGEGSPVNSPQ